MTERNIIIGLITSTEYLDQVAATFDLSLIESAAARTLAKWSIEHYAKFQAAPHILIEDVLMQKIKDKQITDELAEEIQEDILPALSEKYSKTRQNTNYLVKQTEKYFSEQRLRKMMEATQDALDKGDIEEALELVRKHQEIKQEDEVFNLRGKDLKERVEKAFEINNNHVLSYPGALGKFWNDNLTRGSFVGIMAPEKRGKTFLLLDMATRGCRQGRNVAFFQAGDMTEAQQLRRFGIHLAWKSDKEKYCQESFIPVKDCIHNQLNTCEKKEREEKYGVFEHLDRKGIKELTMQDLKDQYMEDPHYRPCYNCLDYETKHFGVPWIQKIPKQSSLDKEEALKHIEQFKRKFHGQLMVSSHANGTLSVAKIKSLLSTWKIKRQFHPDIILVDYADLLVPSTKEFRHGQNEVWKDLRGLSQSENCLVVAPTQTDAKSYEQDTLSLKNFSEDKRKFAHVTAMYGLNQSKDKREKKIGLMRLNELLVREDDLEANGQVTILQALHMGRPFLTSYWGA